MPAIAAFGLNEFPFVANATGYNPGRGQMIRVPGIGGEQLSFRENFKKLACIWKQETRFLSNITAKSIHPAYQKIIGMGESAVPFILEDLRDNGPNHWFWALRVITDKTPVTEDETGNMKSMTEAWLQWGKRVGHLRDCQTTTSSVFQT